MAEVDYITCSCCGSSYPGEILNVNRRRYPCEYAQVGDEPGGVVLQGVLVKTDMGLLKVYEGVADSPRRKDISPTSRNLSTPIRGAKNEPLYSGATS